MIKKLKKWKNILIGCHIKNKLELEKLKNKNEIQCRWCVKLEK